MKLLDSNGKSVTISKSHEYLIDWGRDSRSKFQTSVKEFLRPRWKFDMVFEEFPVPKTRMSLDFFNKTQMIAIEVQGAQHLRYVSHFHGQHNYKFLQQLKRDHQKSEFCSRFGVKLVEIYPEDELTEELFKRFGVDI